MTIDEFDTDGYAYIVVHCDNHAQIMLKGGEIQKFIMLRAYLAENRTTLEM